MHERKSLKNGECLCGDHRRGLRIDRHEVQVYKIPKRDQKYVLLYDWFDLQACNILASSSCLNWMRFLENPKLLEQTTFLNRIQSWHWLIWHKLYNSTQFDPIRKGLIHDPLLEVINATCASLAMKSSQTKSPKRSNAWSSSWVLLGSSQNTRKLNYGKLFLSLLRLLLVFDKM